MRRQFIAVKALLIVSVIVGAILLGGPAQGQTSGENGGLGPLAVRSFFLPTLPFLDFVPDQALTLSAGSSRITYQYAVSNTFLNTDDPGRAGNDPLTTEDIDAGLTPADFGPLGYGIYLDAEMDRHQISFNYGLTGSVEVGIDLAWISLSGGSLDSSVLDVESLFNAVNTDRVGTEEDRMDYYLVYEGEFIYATSQPFSMEPQDPVINLKWNLTRGGPFLPAFSIKLSYKFPLESNPQAPRDVISSGKSDFGYSFLFSKRFSSVIAYFQQAKTELNVPLERFQPSRKYRMFALEYQVNDDNAFIIQVVSQTGLFNPPMDTSEGSTELVFSKQTELSSVGYKYGRTGFQFTAGFTEDLNSTQNEADITIFVELGWKF